MMRFRTKLNSVFALAAALMLAGCQAGGSPSEEQMKAALETYIAKEMPGPWNEDNGLRAKIAEFKKGACERPKEGTIQCAFTVKVSANDPSAAQIIDLLKNGKFYKDDKGEWSVHPGF